MSFINKSRDPRSRAAAIAGAVAIQAALGIAVVTGLTIAGAGPLEPVRRPIIDFPVDPPPPAPPPPPTATPVDQLPPISIPQKPIELPPISSPTFAGADIPPVSPGPVGPPLVNPPRPQPSFAAKGPRPSNDRANWITTADYPAVALRREDEGLAAYRVIVGSDGRVSACEITASSGSRALDEATCRYIARRARFDPATDESGAKVVGNYDGTVRWRIPD